MPEENQNQDVIILSDMDSPIIIDDGGSIRIQHRSKKKLDSLITDLVAFASVGGQAPKKLIVHSLGFDENGDPTKPFKTPLAAGDTFKISSGKRSILGTIVNDGTCKLELDATSDVGFNDLGGQRSYVVKNAGTIHEVVYTPNGQAPQTYDLSGGLRTVVRIGFGV